MLEYRKRAAAPARRSSRPPCHRRHRKSPRAGSAGACHRLEILRSPAAASSVRNWRPPEISVRTAWAGLVPASVHRAATRQVVGTRWSVASAGDPPRFFLRSQSFWSTPLPIHRRQSWCKRPNAERLESRRRAAAPIEEAIFRTFNARWPVTPDRHRPLQARRSVQRPSGLPL